MTRVPPDMGLAAAITIAQRDVVDERWRQLRKWGVQSHPDGTGHSGSDRHRDDVRQMVEDRFEQGVGTWLDILTEEFFEAAAEKDEESLRAELVQVAAVCVAWVEDLDRRKADRLDRLRSLLKAAE